MKAVFAAALVLPALSACVSIELPGVVTDTAKVAKDTYKSVTAKKNPPEAAKPVAEAGNSISNTYVGQDSQTTAEVKQACVSEAADKLFKAHGKEVAYTVTENNLSAVNNAVAAHCRITATKPSQTATTDT